MRILQVTFDEAIEVCKALSNEHRIAILKILTDGPKNINELTDELNIPFSTTALHVKKLEDAGLIKTQIVPGRGNQKVSYKRYERVVIELEVEKQSSNTIMFELEIGDYVHCEIEPTCGLLSETGIIHINDDPRSFYEPERKKAQLIWFRSGFVEYHYPNRLPYGTKPQELSFSVELCSEAPYHKLDWPSDITCWVNNKEIGVWTAPGDFGGERGFLTPDWWAVHNTQFGLLKTWVINEKGSFIDGVQISSLTISELKLQEHPFISLRLGVKKEATNKGGLNLFGSKFGNYAQGLIMKISYER